MTKAWIALSGLAATTLLAACSLVGSVGDLKAAKDGGNGAGGADAAAGSGGSAGTDAGGSGGCEGGVDAGCTPPVSCSPDDSPCTDDNNPCTTDVCKSGSCQHVPLSAGSACGNGKVCDNTGQCGDGCGIGGKVYGAGQANPANTCETCDPTNSPSAWTPAADDSPCTDDGDSCTGDVCAAGICTHPALQPGDSCGTGKVCDAQLACKSGCVIGAQFYADGTANPANPCETCDAATATDGWTPAQNSASCPDDGNPCTQDECQSGTCVHPSKSDSTSCGNGGHCKGGKCTVGCSINSTNYPEGAINPSNPCESCQTAKSSSSWSARPDDTTCGSSSCGKYGNCGNFGGACSTNGTKTRTCTDHVCKSGSCTSPTHTETAGCTRSTDGDSCTDDGSSCTDDLCSGGSCTHPKIAGGVSCGSNKICDGNGGCISGCWISGTLYSNGSSKPGNVCQSCQPNTSTSSWSSVANGTTCASTVCGQYGTCGNFADSCATSGTKTRTCTTYTCQSGTCAGTDKSEKTGCTRSTDGNSCTPDSNVCTDDVCSGGSCTHPTSPDGTSCGFSNGCNVQWCQSGSCVSGTDCPVGYLCCPDGNCIIHTKNCQF